MSNLVIAKDTDGNCGVHVMTSSGGYSEDSSKFSSIAVSWFSCKIGGIELGFGDHVHGAVETSYITRCERSATGAYVKCKQIFKPKN